MWPNRQPHPAQRRSGHASLGRCKQHFIIYFPPQSYRPWRQGRQAHVRPSAASRPCVCVFVWRCVWRWEATTHRGVEGKGALALENPVSCPGNPDGGHVGDQQLSEVCSHLHIPAARSTVVRSHRSGAVRVEDAIFKALRRYIPAASGMSQGKPSK